MVVQSYREDIRHTEQDKELLTFVANHVGAALSRARAIEETRQRNAELALINNVQRGLAENLEMQAMYDLVGDRSAEIFDAQVVDIGILDASAGPDPLPVHDRARRAVPGRADRRSSASAGRSSRRASRSWSTSGRASGWPSADRPCRSQGEPAEVRAVRPARRRRRGDGRDLAPEPRPRARVHRRRRPLLTTLAGSLSVALENARLFDETRQRNAELALINEVQRGLAENLEMQAMYDLVGDRIQEIFDAQVVDIGILDETTGLIRFPYTIERGRAVPRRADRARSGSASTSSRRASRSSSTTTSRRMAERAASRRVLAGEPPKSRCSSRSSSAARRRA